MGCLFIFMSLIFLSADIPLGFLAACDQSRLLQCKEGKSSSDEAARAASLAYPPQRILLDLELWGAEVYQQAMLNAKRTQVAKDLGHMFVRQGLGCFQLDDEAVIREHVGAVVANERAVLENALTD